MWGGVDWYRQSKNIPQSVRIIMWRWLVVWQASLLLVSGTLDLRFFNAHYARSKLDCFDYPSVMPIRTYEPGWGLPRQAVKMLPVTTQKYQTDSIPFIPEITRRVDFLSNREDIIKEHAKLVQDINGLRQVMFVSPMADESKDYEDSIFHEIIETSSTTTSRPSTTKSLRPNKSGIPIVLLGGASRKQITKNQSSKNKRQTLSLIGTSVTPLVRQPSPYILPASPRQPVRICMPSPYSYGTTTRRPSLWERLLKSLIPR